MTPRRQRVVLKLLMGNKDNARQGKERKGEERTDEVDGRDDSFGIQLCQLKDYNCVICFVDTHTQAASGRAADAQPSRRDQLSGLAW